MGIVPNLIYAEVVYNEGERYLLGRFETIEKAKQSCEQDCQHTLNWQFKNGYHEADTGTQWYMIKNTNYLNTRKDETT